MKDITLGYIIITTLIFLLGVTSLFVLQFFIPPIIRENESPNVYFYFCYILAAILNVAFSLYFILSKHPILVIIIWFILALILFYDVIYKIKQLNKLPSRKKFWNCCMCDTENSEDHVVCWKCGYDIEKQNEL